MPGQIDIETLSRALQASWGADTAYLGAVRPSNPAYGQCYPTARVVQHFFPAYEIARGEVWTGEGIETHYWNVSPSDPTGDRLDLSWSQFPPGTEVRSFEILDRANLGDSPATQMRVEVLLGRVLAHLAERGGLLGNIIPSARGSPALATGRRN